MVIYRAERFHFLDYALMVYLKFYGLSEDMRASMVFWKMKAKREYENVRLHITQAGR